MPDRVNVAIIGCGGMGRTHAKTLANIDNVRLKYLVDINEYSALKLKDEVNADSVVTDYRKALEDGEVNLVVICTHHNLHAPMCVDSAKAGKNIFCEKPLALTVDECESVSEAVKVAGVKFMMGFQARFSPFVLKLKEFVPEPWVTIAQLIDPKWADDIWANDPIEGGGNVISQGCHCFDAVCFLNPSPPVSIYAEGGNFQHPKLPIIDTAACTLRFANGRVANITIGDFGHPALLGKSAYQVFAGDVSATLFNYYEQPEVRVWGREPNKITINDIPGCHDSYIAHGYTQQMQAMVDWIAEGKEPLHAAKVYDGLMATKLAVMTFESIRKHQPINI